MRKLKSREKENPTTSGFHCYVFRAFAHSSLTAYVEITDERQPPIARLANNALTTVVTAYTSIPTISANWFT